MWKQEVVHNFVCLDLSKEIVLDYKGFTKRAQRIFDIERIHMNIN